ncbi:MAG: hypothetical protein JW955_09530 [Sedimentisphaerales bacterium]|nr:hypothetical protein [Sedimentisphaerales bacterium]
MTTSSKTVFFALVAVFLTCGCSSSRNLSMAPSPAGEEILYRLKLAKGQSYEIRCITDDRGTQRENTQEFSVDRSIGLGCRFGVNSIDDSGNAVVDCTITWVMYRQKVRGGQPANGMLEGLDPASWDVAYDSSKRDSQTLPEAVGWADLYLVGPKFAIAFLHEKFTITLTPYGQVQEVMGLDALRKRIAQKAGTVGQLMQNGDDASLTQFITQYLFQPLLVYPEQVVHVGDSWTREDQSTCVPYPERKFTLTQRGAGVATIEVNATLEERDPKMPLCWFSGNWTTTAVGQAVQSLG